MSSEVLCSAFFVRSGPPQAWLCLAAPGTVPCFFLQLSPVFLCFFFWQWEPFSKNTRFDTLSSMRNVSFDEREDDKIESPKALSCISVYPVVWSRRRVFGIVESLLGAALSVGKGSCGGRPLLNSLFQTKERMRVVAGRQQKGDGQLVELPPRRSRSQMPLKHVSSVEVCACWSPCQKSRSYIVTNSGQKTSLKKILIKKNQHKKKEEEWI